MANTGVILDDKVVTTRGGALVPSARNMVSNVRALTVQPSFQRAFPTLVALVVVVAGLVAYFLLQNPRAPRFLRHWPSLTNPALLKP